jgi:Fe-S-cluster containining protein
MSNKKITKKQPNKNKKDLSVVLNDIYTKDINLDTTCNHRCECCKVAMPQIYYSEFLNIVTHVWNNSEKEEKLNIICTSIEYFFRYEYEKWGMEKLIKPCVFLDTKGMCSIYEKRPLNCKMYGLWPEEDYNKRVDNFAKRYAKYGLSREELPLHKQCPFVKRVDDSVELTSEIIDSLYKKIDNLDKEIGDFTDLQIENKENYRTFHDWLLLRIFGETWLTQLTAFILAADKETLKDQITQIKIAVCDAFSKDMPKLELILPNK